jgi:glyoxylase-like metal-dependent hydrolase (beta-lactamase superfamily II)
VVGGAPVSTRERAPVARFETRQGIAVFRFPVETFPGHFNNLYLIDDGDQLTLIDAGSRFDSTRRDIDSGLAEIARRFGRRYALADLGHVVITHAHMDHAGNVGYFADETDARVWVHELDARVLSAYEERMVVASKDLAVFLDRCGIAPELRHRLMTMYAASKHVLNFSSVEMPDRLTDGTVVGNDYRVFHTPGHCPGEICLKVDNVLFTGDHVLARTTPHQSPESITLFCGLRRYLESLERIHQVGGIELALGGHEDEMTNVYGRIHEIRAFHLQRLDRLREMCREPRTIWDVTLELFAGRLEGYTQILGIEEAGAHIEYLYQLGELAIANLDEVQRSDNPVLYYRTRR